MAHKLVDPTLKRDRRHHVWAQPLLSICIYLIFMLASIIRVSKALARIELVLWDRRGTFIILSLAASDTQPNRSNGMSSCAMGELTKPSLIVVSSTIQVRMDKGIADVSKGILDQSQLFELSEASKAFEVLNHRETCSCYLLHR